VLLEDEDFFFVFMEGDASFVFLGILFSLDVFFVMRVVDFNSNNIEKRKST
jgi:hypothetical protein